MKNIFKLAQLSLIPFLLKSKSKERDSTLANCETKFTFAQCSVYIKIKIFVLHNFGYNYSKKTTLVLNRNTSM